MLSRSSATSMLEMGFAQLQANLIEQSLLSRTAPGSKPDARWSDAGGRSTTSAAASVVLPSAWVDARRPTPDGATPAGGPHSNRPQLLPSVRWPSGGAGRQRTKPALTKMRSSPTLSIGGMDQRCPTTAIC